MILHNEYLTDEELEMLISETEDELVPAPPEMMEVITNIIWNKSQVKDDCGAAETRRKISQSKKTGKWRGFAVYCFRVAMSVAAAIAFMCIMPNLPGFSETDGETERQEYTNKESFLKENGNVPRQEVYTTYPSREEVLNDKSMMQRLLGREKLFDDNLETFETPKAPDEPGVELDNIPTTENRNNDKMNDTYENGGQLL